MDLSSFLQIRAVAHHRQACGEQQRSHRSMVLCLKVLPVLLPGVQFPRVCFPQFGGQNTHDVDKEQEIDLQVQKNGFIATSGVLLYYVS